jgi:hypothetical protein
MKVAHVGLILMCSVTALSAAEAIDLPGSKVVLSDQ